MNDDNERRLPPRLPEKLVPNKVRTGSWRQEAPPKAPSAPSASRATPSAPLSATATSSTGRTSTNATSTCGRKPACAFGGPSTISPASGRPIR